MPTHRSLLPGASSTNRTVCPSVRPRPFFFLFFCVLASSSPAFHVGFSIPIQRGASEPNYYDSSPPDSVGPFDLPPFSMIPRYLGRLCCPGGLGGGTPRAVEEERRLGVCVRTCERGREGRMEGFGEVIIGGTGIYDKLSINEDFFPKNLRLSLPSASALLRFFSSSRLIASSGHQFCRRRATRERGLH